MTDAHNFELIRSHRRSVSIEINLKGKVIVKAPLFLPSFIINKFVRDKSEWITRKLKSLPVLPRKNTGALTEGDEILFLGKMYKIEAGNYKSITLKDKLYFPKALMFRIQKEITGWYISQAKKIITERVVYYSSLMKKEYRSIAFSDTISKWGSCTPDNRLQFNWRLIMSPILVLDYVVVHELTHTTEKNHRSKFWKEVAIYKPAYKQYVKWL
ncbi:MAG: SprT family zinc-dependent metalloprotease, partial [Bacteroidota bacterium]